MQRDARFRQELFTEAINAYPEPRRARSTYGEPATLCEAALGTEPAPQQTGALVDRKRKDKKVSYAEWASPVHPASRIMKLKDGRTHFSYKAEHAIDLESDHAGEPRGRARCRGLWQIDGQSEVRQDLLNDRPVLDRHQQAHARRSRGTPKRPARTRGGASLPRHAPDRVAAPASGAAGRPAGRGRLRGAARRLAALRAALKAIKLGYRTRKASRKS